jgi:hypothetical protein
MEFLPHILSLVSFELKFFWTDANILPVCVQTIVDNYNIASTGQAEWYPVAFFLRDENGTVRGGLLGDYLGGLAACENACDSQASARA